MENNLKEILRVIDWIEERLLEEKLDLATIAGWAGYSKYHLHRMFTAVVGMPPHVYIQRRRLTEAARLLIHTDRKILDIALCSGYETQRSFSTGFRACFKCTPDTFRKHGEFLPLQLKFVPGGRERGGNRMKMEIFRTEAGQIRLIGYSADTRRGFSVMGKAFRKLHREKGKIAGRTDKSFLIGVNDYSGFELEERQPAFRFIAAVEVDSTAKAEKGMEELILPPSGYVVFRFHGRNEDSMQPVAEYIYQEWFPQSTCRFNEKSPYDFVKYGEEVDEKGESVIEYWVPVLEE